MFIDWIAPFTSLWSSRSTSNARDGRDIGWGATPYRTSAARLMCACGPLEEDGLRAYLRATDKQRAAATETLICAFCDRRYGVKIGY